MNKKINSLRKFHGGKGKGSVISRVNGYRVSPDILREEASFNSRFYNCDDVENHVERLKQSYMDGVSVPPILVQVVDGELYVRDGHCRLMAIRKAKQEGFDLEKVAVEEFQGDKSDSLALQATLNGGLPLTPLELSELYCKMSECGLSQREIASKVQKTSAHVSQHLKMEKLPSPVKTHVRNGSISAINALKMLIKHGVENVTSVVDNAVKVAGGEGKSKAASSHLVIEGLRGSNLKVFKKSFAGFKEVFKGAVEVSDDKYVVEMSGEQLDFMNKSIGMAQSEK